MSFPVTGTRWFYFSFLLRIGACQSCSSLWFSGAQAAAIWSLQFLQGKVVFLYLMCVALLSAALKLLLCALGGRRSDCKPSLPCSTRSCSIWRTCLTLTSWGTPQCSCWQRTFCSCRGGAARSSWAIWALRLPWRWTARFLGKQSCWRTSSSDVSGGKHFCTRTFSSQRWLKLPAKCSGGSETMWTHSSLAGPSAFCSQ